MKKITLLLMFLFISITGYSQLALEGFENTTGPDPDPLTNWTLQGLNWAVFDNSAEAGFTSTVRWDINTTSTLVYNGLNAAYINRENIGAGNTSEEFLATPAVQIPTNGVLHFYTRMFTSGNQGTIYQIRVAPATASQTDPNAYSLVQQWTEDDLITPTSNFNVYTEKTVDLSAFSFAVTGQFYYVSFVKVYTQLDGNLGGDRWLVDDVSIDAACLTPTAVIASTPTSNSVSLNWTNPNGTVTEWEIEAVLASGTPTGIPTHTTPSFPYVVTGLLPNTAYKFYVRARCTTGISSPWSVVSNNITTLVAPPVCGGNLVDSGGTGANYGNNQNISLTVDPDVPGNLVTVTFTAFNTEAGADILRIYDGGAGTVGPATLIATLSGTAIPPSYTATSATGQLTFVFTSNATVTAAGYAANITCGPPPACRIPSNVSVSTLTTTGATINWTQPANPDTTVATVFDIIALPAGSAAPNASSVPTFNDVTPDAGPSFTLTGLASGTCFDVYVRAVCAGNSGWSIVGTRVCTLVAPPVCGGNYVDSGGTGGDYSNNVTQSSWICPTTNTDAVTVTFTAFNLAAGDTMTIYDGDTASATLLGTYTGTTFPPAFTSTAASGCLLFVFSSNATGTAAGWLANVTCAPKATCTPPIALANNTVLHNSAILNWVQPANPDASVSTSWNLYVVPCGSPAPTAGTIPTVTVTTAPPYTLTGLLPVTCYNVYVRSACGSTWTGPTVFTTLAAPPECGGNYVDNGGTTANYTANANVTTVICPTNPGDVVTVTFSIFNTEATWDGIYVYNGNTISSPQIASTNPIGNGPMTTPGAYWGNVIPCPFTSTDASGCLTFVFRSDASVQNPGFVASITCAPPPTCAAPTAITSSTITYNSATLNWTQPANPDTTVATSWDVYYVACGSPAPTAATLPSATVTTAPPYTLTGLTPLTCYDIYVRANCGASVSVWPCTPTTITTAPAPPVCGGTFVDAGGPTAAYGANSDQTTTICPTNPGDVVTVTFTAFNTQANSDALYVYNGNSAVVGNLIPSTNPAGTVPGGLAGGYWGTAIPCSFTSADASGCLTFVFRSNATVQNAGWIANVTCAPPTACATPISLTSGTVTHNSAILNWTQPANPDTTVATSWDVYYVACGSPAPTAATVPSASATTAPPYTLTGLAPATCFDIYVRANCGTSFSAWSCPTTITTLAAPPECGGNYVDNGGTTANYTANANVTTTICPTNPGDVVTVTFTTFNTEATWDGIYVYNGNSVSAPQIASANPTGNGPLAALAGAYWGNVIPCPFISSDASGCLTFVFRSDGSVQNPGFIANITCGPPPTCNIPTATVGSNVRHNSVTLNWTQPANADGSFASAWDIYYVACGSPAPTAATIPNATTTTAPPYTLTGLTPLTCYDIYVRANCGSTTSPWTCIPVTITTLAVPPTCNQVFTDAGGATGAYANNSNIPTYICPTNPGDVVTVTFTSFNTDANNDGLYVYDGNTIGVSQIASTNGAGAVPGGLPGSYWGNLTGGNLPGPFTSTTADGCLTFVFRSNGFTTAAGWVANVTCAPAPTCARPLLIATISLDQTSAILTWTQPLNPNGTQAAAWEVLVLPGGSTVPTGAGIPVSGTSYTVTGLTPGTTYEFYVRAICGPNDASIWSGFTFSTQPLNDECANAAFAIVNQNLNCVQTTHGTLVGATGSLPATTCGGAGAANDDVWFTFTATAVTHIISFNNVTANTLSYAIYSGTCDGLTQVGCNSGANLVPGTTYYIRVFSTSTSPFLTTFDMCIGTLPCTEAPAFCTGQTVTYANATNVPSLGSIGCLGTSPNPAFFFLQVNAAGPLSYLISQVDNGGTPRDVDYVAWGPFTDLNTACSGVPANPLGQTVPIPTPTTGCPGTLHACSYSTAAQEIMCIPNAQLCQVYVIMITNFSNQAGTVTFTQTNAGGGTTACFPINTFNYPLTYYCQNATNPTPVLAPGAAAGVYSSTPGLVIDPVTGTIDLLASTPGPYVVTSTSATTIGGTCSTIPFITTTRTVIITAPASATISYPAATYCTSITSTQAVVRSGTAGGTYSSTPAGLLLNAITGEIIPVASTAGNYTVTYTIPAIGGCSVFTTTTQVEILASPIVLQPNVTACDTFTLPALAVGNYFAAAGGVGTPLDISIPITTPGINPVYIYASATNGCITEKSFNVTINTVPVPTYTVTQSTCATPTGTITVTSPVSAGSPLPANLFISEVTDADTGSLSYVEIYNGTGAPVNLSNYKIRTFNNGSATATVGCENILAGILANNSTYVVSVGSLTNLGGVVPNQVFGGCSGVNIDDTIKLTTLTDTVIDLWGRTDGVAFTPLNQPGYTYRRLNTATVPSTTWNPADWTALDPEDYSNVGSYSYTVSNYQYSVDNGTFQTETLFSNVAIGDHTLMVKDLSTGCFSAPITVTINPLNPITAVTGFSYTTPVCQNATPNSTPGGFAAGFTAGGVYSEAPATTGLVFINTATGEIDLLNSTPGIHTVNYTVANNPALCLTGGQSSASIEIKSIITPVTGFSYTTPVCKNVSATLSPTLASGFTTGGIFSSTTGLSINGTTGVIDLAASTAGPYTITYTLNPIASSCQLGGTNTATIVINPVITLVTAFDYDTPFCATSGSELPNLAAGFTTGGTFSSTTGLIINPSTGAIDLTSTPGGYTVTYTVNPNASNCEVATPGTTQIMIIAPVTIELTGGCQSENYVLTANGSFNPETTTFSWHNAAGADMGDTQSITVTAIGVYTVTVTVDGCSTDSIPFDVESVFCIIQKGISVNNDGKNDTFDLTGFDVKKLSIFNRLGMKVYSRNDYVNEWGGKSDNGEELPDGTYYFVIERNSGDTKTGWIYINRAQ